MAPSDVARAPAELIGACHCGFVRVRVTPSFAGIVACHCVDCHRLHGNYFAMVVADRSDVRWEGEEAVRWYCSSPENERGFCDRCGSRVAKRPRGGAKIMLSAGLFAGSLDGRVVKNLWLEQRPGWCDAPRVGPLTPQAFVDIALADAIESETAQYGYALRSASDNKKPPGVIGLTWITAADASERDRIRAHARQNVEDFLDEPGFISIVTGFTGLRGFTVTAWEDEASMKRGLSKHHAVAMRELFGERFVASVWTSVWTPTRTNRIWVRCPSCGALEDVSDDHRACSSCHSSMPERPAFW